MHFPTHELEFLEEALRTVIKCREVLKWTYAMAYMKEDQW